MTNVFFSAVVCFFALFGVIQLVKNIINEISRYNNDFFIVISVKNQQDHIEEIIRTTVWKSLNKLGGREVPQIYVVDCGSTDDTLAILERICRDYEFVTVMSREEYIALMEKE
ncbi:MAG: glycosyltransferase [Eubacteriales bacterium]|mgnify:CR=1 FL=1|jgi:S-ribosylhomocysteine lyase LuxS involved in autoinducer biosynthesis|nr:glycosyltransferase [Eubacteriales bacterium]